MKKIDFKDLIAVENEIVNGNYYVHNGYFGYSYGSPLNPKRISKKTALDILNIYFERTGKHPIVEMKKNLNDLVYTEEYSKLFKETMGNRIIGFYSPDNCIYENGEIDAEIYTFDLS